MSQQQLGSEAAVDAWWPRVCETGAEFLRRAVPRWGDARYLWDVVEQDEPNPARLGWRGTLVSLAVVLGGAALAGISLRLVWVATAALVHLF